MVVPIGKPQAKNPVPGKNCRMIKIVERDYPNTYAKFTAVGPLLEQLGNGSKGLNWDMKTEGVKQLGDLNHRVTELNIAQGQPRLNTAVNASEMILMLAPEAMVMWRLRAGMHCLNSQAAIMPTLPNQASMKKSEIRFKDIVAQPRKIISSPTWSGIGPIR